MALSGQPRRGEYAHHSKQVERRQQVRTIQRALIFLMLKEPFQLSGKYVSTPFELHGFMQDVEQESVQGYLRDYGNFPRSDPALVVCSDEERLPHLELWMMVVPTADCEERVCWAL